MTHERPQATESETIAGLYKHHKGAEYTVLGTGTHTETHEEFVVYRSDDMPEDEFHIRPKAMFFDQVAKEGITKLRFKKKDE